MFIEQSILKEKNDVYKHPKGLVNLRKSGRGAVGNSKVLSSNESEINN